MRLHGAVRLYLTDNRQVLARTTIKNRRYELGAFSDHCGPIALRAVQPKHISQWLGTREVEPSTYRVKLSIIRTFFRWAIEHRHTRIDPTLLIRTPRQRRRAPRAFEMPHIRDLSLVLPDARARLIIALMLEEGMRRAEVARLDFADVDFYTDTLRVVGKGDHERILPITHHTRERLDKYLAERGKGPGPLIRSLVDPTRGITPGYVGELVSKWLREAAVKQGPHDGRSAHALRHTTAEQMYRNGADLRTIAAALGHQSPNTTWIYLRHTHSVEDLRAAMGHLFT